MTAREVRALSAPKLEKQRIGGPWKYGGMGEASAGPLCARNVWRYERKEIKGATGEKVLIDHY